MSNDDIQNLQKVVDEQIQENLGMSMIYTIVSAAQEWMQERVSWASSLHMTSCLSEMQRYLLPGINIHAHLCMYCHLMSNMLH